MEMEIWKPVPSVPQLEASSWGRIRRKPHVGVMPHGGVRQYRSEPTWGTIRRAKPTAQHSYRGYYYRGIGNVKVHQLVCEAFHGLRPFPKAVVIHDDENAHNNKPGNVRWGTQKENLNSPGFIAYRKSRKGSKSPTAVARKSLSQPLADVRVHDIEDIGQ